MTVIWFLVIINFKGGLLSIAQQSGEGCIHSAAAINSRNDGATFAYCVSGIE